jgi:mono/diheme cytochrome c family protein
MKAILVKLWMVCSVLWSWIGLAVAAENAPQFARDIQPLLAKHCLLCHGPDESEGGLRLHNRIGALAELDSGEHAIVPGNPSESQMLARINTDDPDLRMPPEGDGLSAEEIALLSQWIREGANWEVHWAYRPLDSALPPEVKNRQAVRNDIDPFVIAKLEEENVEPSPEADRYTLVKRLYYDLIGLPPEPEDVDRFVHDASGLAYENLVDRLLASRHFGERWGRHWLDKARYADSDGYEKDRDRPDAWRYRDWVIDAINQDMPFDQFTIEQLAGDMLPDAEPMQRLATAFNRQTLTNTEGGTDKEQWRVAAVMDRTETLGTVWLGLSVGCARCHTHKYDQITQREYYELYAYFNNGDEVDAEVPKELRADPVVQGQRRELAAAIARRRQEVAHSIDAWLPDLQARAEASVKSQLQFHSLREVSITGPEGVTFTLQEDGSWLTGGQNPATAKYTIEASCDVPQLTGIRVEVLPDESLSARGPGRTEHGNFVLNEIRLYAAPKPNWGKADQRNFVSAVANFSQSGWPVANAIDGREGPSQKGTGWAISPQFGKPHTADFFFDQPLDDGLRHLQIVLSQTYGSQHTIGRFRISAITGVTPDAELPKEILQIARSETPDEAGIQRLIEFRQSRDSQLLELQRRLQGLADEVMKVRVIGQRTRDLRQTHVLRRGEFKQPMKQVSTGTFATLPPIRSRDGVNVSDRLDLARWLVGGENPLVPRVTVNHVWKHLFGEGIVPTMNDFGVRGDPPSHPKLLDHLAMKLIDGGWSRKALIKYIVMSATYRQSSRHRPKLVDLDPNNRLLHRQNRFRVEAEIVRDITLAASGLLSRKVGGPSVFPPIPPGVTDLTYNSSFKWKTSQGADRYRRGMYTYFKRTAPHPNLITFDCPDSNITNVDRDRSNTPIGALVTLNNESFVEAAQAMAQYVLQHTDLQDDDSLLRFALRRCIVRVPTQAEVDDFAQLLAASRKWYRDNPDAAEELVGARAASGVVLEENAAWIATLRIMLNLDEFLTRE